MGLLNILPEFKTVYFDNSALKYKARNMSDKKALQTPRFIEKYINYVDELSDMLEANGVIIREVYEEMKGYTGYLEKNSISDDLLNRYNELIEDIKPRDISTEKITNFQFEKLSATDRKLLEIIHDNSDIGLVTNDLELIKAGLELKLSG